MYSNISKPSIISHIYFIIKIFVLITGLEPDYSEQSSNKNNFIIIGLCLGILGLIYVGAVLIYLKVRKNRRQASRQNRSQENTTESIEETNCEVVCTFLTFL